MHAPLHRCGQLFILRGGKVIAEIEHGDRRMKMNFKKTYHIPPILGIDKSNQYFFCDRMVISKSCQCQSA